MSDAFNQSLDPNSRGQADVHFARQAEVIFVKKAQTFVEPGVLGEPANVEVNKKYREFIQSGIMVRSMKLILHDLIPEAPPNVPGNTSIYSRNEYWTISTSSIGAVSKIGGTSQLLPNGDVSRVSVVSSCKDPSTATIVIRNPQEKYTFQRHPLYLGQTVFDSDDTVYINMTGQDNKIHRVFTGLITTIRMSVETGDSLNSTITLECKDMLKRLWETRTNAKPSIDAREANGATTNSYTSKFAEMLPHEILTSIFARAYCDLYSVSGFRSQLEGIRALVPTNPANAAIQEEELVQNLTKLPGGGGSGTSGSDSSVLIVRQGKVDTTGVGEIRTPTRSVDADLPRRVYGFRQAKRALTTNENTISSASPVSTEFLADDMAFIIEGTAQPVYVISFASFGLDRWISEWQSAYSVAKKIADDLNFELNTTPEGVVRFRPLNTLLPADIEQQQTSTQVPSNQRPRVGYEYWLQRKFIKSESYNETDDGIVTIAYVLGTYEFSNLNAGGLQYLKAGVAVDSRRMAKLGARMAPQQSRLELLSREACQAYARAYLHRINAKARTATVTYVGDARLRSGEPCYIPHRNRIYYIDTVTHDFQAGGSFTTTLSLTYGRLPIALAPGKATELNETIGKADPVLASDLIGRYSYDATIARLTSSNEIDPVTKVYAKANSQTELERYKAYGPDGNKQLVFNGYVWEDLPLLTLEELVTDYKITNKALFLEHLAQSWALNSKFFTEQVVAMNWLSPLLTPAAITTKVLATTANQI